MSVNDELFYIHCRHGNLDGVKFCVKRIANINTIYTGAYHAILWEHFHILKFLVHNMDVYASNLIDFTIRRLRSYTCQKALIFLITLGAKLNLPQYLEVSQLIEKYWSSNYQQFNLLGCSNAEVNRLFS